MTGGQVVALLIAWIVLLASITSMFDYHYTYKTAREYREQSENLIEIGKQNRWMEEQKNK